VSWIAVTTLPTVFVPFQSSRYYYVPLVGVAILVGVVGTEIQAWASRRNNRHALPVAGAVYLLYLAHAVWGVQLEESDYEYMGDLHRQASESFRSEVIERLPPPDGPLTLFARGDTMVWADALQQKCNDRPWYWPTTYKWVYRRPHGILGLTNTYGFVTYCLDERHRGSLFAAASLHDYERAIAGDDFVVVIHSSDGNSFRIASPDERSRLAVAARESDLYRYLQPGRIDAAASGLRQLGH
jgi:hypothetical protein